MSLTLDPTVVTITQPVSMAAEQYRVLCAKLNKLSKDSGMRVIAVTSAVKGEGKTLTAVNLAMAMAKDFDRFVLLVEADLKSPTLARLLGRKMNGGLRNLLADQTDLAKSGLIFFDGRLTILPAGKGQGHDLRLLGSKRARDFIQENRTRYDYIIMDLPPILPLADANVLSDLVDGVLMVIRAGHTPQSIVKRAMADLDPKKVIGVVLNDVRSFMSYYYYYHRQEK